MGGCISIIVGTYGPGIEKMRQERQTIWFELGEVGAGCISDKVICLLERRGLCCKDKHSFFKILEWRELMRSKI